MTALLPPHRPRSKPPDGSFRAHVLPGAVLVLGVLTGAVLTSSAFTPASAASAHPHASKTARRQRPPYRPHWQLAITTPSSSGNGEAPLPAQDLWGAGPSPEALVFMNGISCASSRFCAAVGQYQDADGALSGLVDVLWKGQWRAYAPPEPQKDGLGAGPGVAGNAANNYSEVDAATCPKVGWCLVAGNYSDTAGVRSGLLDTFADGHWSAQVAPEPAKNAAGEVPGEVQTHTGLLDVQCVGTQFCVGVGQYNDAVGKTYGLIDTYSGGKWTGIDAPEPSGRTPIGTVRGTDNNGGQFAQLNAVSCSSTTSCVAVGDYEDVNQTRWPLIDTWDGKSWTASLAPEPLNKAAISAARKRGASLYGGYGFLQGVSCTPRGTCTAVGQWADGTARIHALVDTLTSGAWRAATAPLPLRDLSGQGAATAAGNAEAFLLRVACPLPSYCIGAGDYRDRLGKETGLLDVLQKGRWRPYRAPEPRTDAMGGGPALDSSIGGDNSFKDVACTSPNRGGRATMCVSVGSYGDAKGNDIGLIETFQDGRWHATVAPAPVGPFQLGITPRQAVLLQAVTCDPQGTCFAVGNYQDNQGLTYGLVDTYR
ncbi:MAG TPA: hypothetical protein VFN61_10105 [Acidimicrobiales bacterium]|nr:hypothetical protein [Acidimicrobiales bacterium]